MILHLMNVTSLIFVTLAHYKVLDIYIYTYI